ncbi:MAG: DNA primase, partial [uncultured Solirubrobacteraceae bacterium]
AALHRRLPRPRPRRGGLRRPRRHPHGAAPLGPGPLRGAVPLPRGAHPVLRDRPRPEGLPLLRLPGRGRRLHLRAGDGGPGLRRRAGVPGRPLRRAARAGGRGPRGRRAPSAPGAPARAARADGHLLRPLPVGLGGGGPRPRVPGLAGARGGGAADVPRRLRALALRRGVDGEQARGLLRPRVLRRGARPALEVQRRGHRPVPPADRLPPLRPARAGPGLRGAGARGRPAAQVPQLLRQRGLPQGAPRVRRGHRPGPRDPGGQRRAVRGLHGRHRAAPGGAAQRGRPHGDGAHGRAGRRARPPGAEGPARAGRRRRGPERDAAGGAGGRGAAARAAGGAPAGGRGPCRRRAGARGGGGAAPGGREHPVRALPGRPRARARRPGLGGGRRRRPDRARARLRRPAAERRAQRAARARVRADGAGR